LLENETYVQKEARCGIFETYAVCCMLLPIGTDKLLCYLAWMPKSRLYSFVNKGHL